MLLVMLFMIHVSGYLLKPITAEAIQKEIDHIKGRKTKEKLLQARKFGTSKFMGWNRFVNGYLDLLTLWFLSTFGKKPMHIFGFLGTLVFMVGFFSAIGIGVDKLWALSQGIPQRLVTDSPWFYIALTMMMIGTQLFLAGFIGDLLSRSSQNRNDYQIEEEIRCGK